MVIVICPECGSELDSEKVDVVAHAYSHWQVMPRDIGTLRNIQAQERYNTIMERLNGGNE